MDRKEIAKAIRAELKENGITNKQVGVTSKSALYDDVIRVNIKDLKVNYSLVNEIASKYKSISYDQYNGEILAGGNTYVSVNFDYDSILTEREKYFTKAQQIMKQGEDYNENESMTIISKGNLTILYQSKWCNGNPPSISLNEKPEGWEKETCYCLTNIKRYEACSKESIAETLLMIDCQYGIDVLKEEQQDKTNLFKITSKQWQKTSKDYKSVINGVKYIYKNNGLEPVEIDDINGNELRTYLFEECYITYNVLAWNVQDAERIAKDCGHIKVENLRLKPIEKKDTITEKKPQQQNSEEEKQKNNDITVSVKFNKDKNGIELHFTDKPNQEVREQIKSNGFRWSHPQKIWFTKDTEERREFLKSIGFLNTETNNNESITVSEVEKNIENIEYPTIDINDIETYTVSKELSKRENSISMFRSKDTDHTKVLQHTLQSANDDVIELIKMEGCTPYIEYKAKTMLQSFKKNYTNAYTSVLEHKANNPSWAVTGRGGLNVSRYNKKQNQLTNKMKHESELIHKFNYRIEQFQNQIRNNQKQKLKIELENNLNFIEQIPKFKRVKVKINGDAMANDNIFDLTNASYTKEKTGHQLDGYTIIKNWGCFRIYNPKGAEVWHTKTNENLDVAKKYVLYLLSKEQKKKAI
ncbi:hypothetical protein [Clostridium sporogenes]|uniref:hypothetical protein n=1 Tax=Clostridium sporogenes TaxID=1509 RepID=UPI0013D627F0|nr:hypothetical protein [Clostridium sporogenes]NFH40734.1 hypothetical protein [Clostridium sporogenes]